MKGVKLLLMGILVGFGFGMLGQLITFGARYLPEDLNKVLLVISSLICTLGVLQYAVVGYFTYKKGKGDELTSLFINGITYSFGYNTIVGIINLISATLLLSKMGSFYDGTGFESLGLAALGLTAGLSLFFAFIGYLVMTVTGAVLYMAGGYFSKK